MNKRVRIGALTGTLILGSVVCTSAYAVSSLTVNAPGTNGQPTKLSLFNRNNEQVATGEGDLSATNIQPGAYRLRAQDPSGRVTTTDLQVEDETSCNYRVDAQTGKAERVRCVPLLVQRQQQQQQEPWSFVGLGGFKRTPYSTVVESPWGSGNVDLEDSGGLFSFEGRYHLPNANNSDFFLFGGLDLYAGLDKTRTSLDFHPTPGDDTGASIEEKYGFRLGLGGSWGLTEKIRMELQGGVHATRVSAGVHTDESGGGGVYNQFTKDETVFGPTLGVGLTFPIYTIPGSNRPVNGMLRYTANWMPDMDIYGMSTLGFTYTGQVEGGRQDVFQLGVLIPF